MSKETTQEEPKSSDDLTFFEVIWGLIMAPIFIAALIALIVGVVVLVSSFSKNEVRIHYKESVIEKVESRWWGLSKDTEPRRGRTQNIKI